MIECSPADVAEGWHNDGPPPEWFAEPVAAIDTTVTDIPVIDIKGYRSVSQLTSYLSCAESYRLSRIAKAPRKPAAWLMQGIAFHSAIEFWEKEDRKPDIDMVHAVYCDSWDDEQAKVSHIAWDQWLTGTPKRNGKADIEQRHPKGLQQVSDYMEWAESEKDKWRILTLPNGEKGLEQRFEMDLGVPGNLVRIIGYIDQMVEYSNGAIRPRDLKTGTKLPDWTVQLGVYSMAMRKCFGIDNVWVGDYYMAKNKNVTKPYDLRMFSDTYVTDWFHTLNDAIDREIFLPNPGSMCNVCDVWQWCSAVGPNRGEY